MGGYRSLRSQGRRWNWSRWLVRELPQPVVPANAGTHTPRLLSLSAAARRLSNNEHQWLSVPAFAGTTIDLKSIAWGKSASLGGRRVLREKYAAASQLERRGATAFQQRTWVVIGPCVRRDDDGIGADG